MPYHQRFKEYVMFHRYKTVFFIVVAALSSYYGFYRCLVIRDCEDIREHGTCEKEAEKVDSWGAKPAATVYYRAALFNTGIVVGTGEYREAWEGVQRGG